MIHVITESLYSNSLVEKFKGNSVTAVADKIVDPSLPIVQTDINQSLIIRYINNHHSAMLVCQDNMIGMLCDDVDQLDTVQNFAANTRQVYLFQKNNKLVPHETQVLNGIFRKAEQLFVNSEIFSINPIYFSSPNRGFFKNSILAKDHKLYLNGYHQIAEYKHG